MVYAIPTYELRSTPAFGRRRRLPPAAAAMLVISIAFMCIGQTGAFIRIGAFMSIGQTDVI